MSGCRVACICACLFVVTNLSTSVLVFVVYWAWLFLGNSSGSMAVGNTVGCGISVVIAVF